ncbi:MAG: hypothetical protein KGI27_12405 [Thaumarchaeota archaeon]|nr:hypothetical protein [Nitrososphaerota archaeon]
MKTSLYTIFVLIAMSSMAISPAFAANPYIAGYPTQSLSTHKQYTMDVNFAGTPAGGQSHDIGAVFSSAGFTHSGDTTPNGWVDQNVIDLQTTGEVYGADQVWDFSTCKSNCVNPDTTDLGSIGSGTNNISYVYSTYYWTSNPYLDFYYEPHFNSGSSI